MAGTPTKDALKTDLTRGCRQSFEGGEMQREIKFIITMRKSPPADRQNYPRKILILKETFKRMCLANEVPLSYCSSFLEGLSYQKYRSKAEEYKVKMFTMAEESNQIKKGESVAQRVGRLLVERERVVRKLRKHLMMKGEKDDGLMVACVELDHVRMYNLLVLEELETWRRHNKLPHSSPYFSQAVGQLSQDLSFINLSLLSKHLDFGSDDPLFIVPLQSSYSSHHQPSVRDFINISSHYSDRLFNANVAYSKFYHGRIKQNPVTQPTTIDHSETIKRNASSGSHYIQSNSIEQSSKHAKHKQGFLPLLNSRRKEKDKASSFRHKPAVQNIIREAICNYQQREKEKKLHRPLISGKSHSQKISPTIETPEKKMPTVLTTGKESRSFSYASKWSTPVYSRGETNIVSDYNQGPYDTKFDQRIGSFSPTPLKDIEEEIEVPSQLTNRKTQKNQTDQYSESQKEEIEEHIEEEKEQPPPSKSPSKVNTEPAVPEARRTFSKKQTIYKLYDGKLPTTETDKHFVEKMRKAKRRNFPEVHKAHEYDPNILSLQPQLQNHYKSPFDLLGELKSGLSYKTRAVTQPTEIKGIKEKEIPDLGLTFMRVEKSDRESIQNNSSRKSERSEDDKQGLRPIQPMSILRSEESSEQGQNGQAELTKVETVSHARLPGQNKVKIQTAQVQVEMKSKNLEQTQTSKEQAIKENPISSQLAPSEMKKQNTGILRTQKVPQPQPLIDPSSKLTDPRSVTNSDQFSFAAQDYRRDTLMGSSTNSRGYGKIRKYRQSSSDGLPPGLTRKQSELDDLAYSQDTSVLQQSARPHIHGQDCDCDCDLIT